MMITFPVNLMLISLLRFGRRQFWRTLVPEDFHIFSPLEIEPRSGENFSPLRGSISLRKIKKNLLEQGSFDSPTVKQQRRRMQFTNFTLLPPYMRNSKLNGPGRYLNHYKKVIFTLVSTCHCWCVDHVSKGVCFVLLCFQKLVIDCVI